MNQSARNKRHYLEVLMKHRAISAAC